LKLRQRQNFLNIRTEGSILPADLLQRITERDPRLKGLAPEDYHLLPSVRLNEAINQSWTRLIGAWQSFQFALQKSIPGDLGTTLTREKWLLPIFQELGYGRLTTARAIEIGGRTFPVSHAWQQAPIHLVSARIGLDERVPGIAGAARLSPHGLLQDLLNRSDQHLWGIVSNGLNLRLLRDNVSLTRQAYLEFDLDAIFAGESYSDFTLLWLLCHQSRVELREPEHPESCWLEEWSKEAHEQGTRALDQLRNGVQLAIEALGRGFLAHPQNQNLVGLLRDGALDRQDYYRQLLRLVYRLLYLFVAEDRDLLMLPESDATARERYLRFYSVSRLRRLAERRVGTRHHDQYHALRLVMHALGDQGAPELGLPALGGFLFSSAAIEAISDCEIANQELLEAIRALAFINDGQMRRTVDYRNLRSEELGSVYEALLELHPEINLEARQFSLSSASGNERKTSGSYYTPESLVQCLLDSALDPVVTAAIERAAPQGRAAIEAAILNLKVVDPACGSGHFLIAAAHRLARHLATVRTGDGEPSPPAIRQAMRDVIGHCIYGVDINPMAVELCKVSLWMEALQPGKPLSFLDHRLRCGNSLIGATPALLKKGIPDDAFKPIQGDDKSVCSEYRRLNHNERRGQRSIFESEIKLGRLATTVLELEAVSDDTIAGVREKQRRWEEIVSSNDYKFGGLLADAWCAAFVWKKIADRQHPHPITEELFRRIEQNPWSVIPSRHFTEIERLAAQYRFFHWHLAFPDVFRPAVNDEVPENLAAGWCGGFDVVLGNPPWERIKLQEKEWFAQRNPEIVAARTAAERKRLIDELLETDPGLLDQFHEDLRKAEGESHFLRQSHRYPLCGKGDINTYSIFAEATRTIVSPSGNVGCIVQSGIATDDTTKEFFQDLINTGSLHYLYDFENREGIFPRVDSRFKFCLLTILGGGSVGAPAEFVFFAHQIRDLGDAERRFTLTADDLALLNPNTRTCPTFRSRRDARLTTAIYRRVPILIREGDPDENPWGIRFKRMLDMANDSGLFLTEEKLTEQGYRREGNRFSLEDRTMLPLYEAKMIHQFDHRWAGYDGLETVDVTTAQKQNPQFQVMPRYWVPKEAVVEKLSRDGGAAPHWLLGWRDICRSTDERTVISSIIPPVGVGHTMPIIQTVIDTSTVLCLQGNLSSYVLDYCARQKIGGTHLTYGYINQLPILSPSAYFTNSSWAVDTTHRQWIGARVLELIYSSNDMVGIARECGYTESTITWNTDRRFLLRAELDAAFFHLYGIARDDVEYILETFPIVRRKDEAAHGEFRTKRVILEIYDALAGAMTTGEAYQTRLDPPPALGWTPPEVELPAATAERPFALKMVDGRPQPKLFDLE
jgi:hypothetical protein